MNDSTLTQIKEILQELISAEERTFFGAPMIPEITGIDEAAEAILDLFNSKLKESITILSNIKQSCNN